jgi:hypothetical protein
MNRIIRKAASAFWTNRLAAVFVLLTFVSMSVAAVGANAGCAVPLTGKLPAATASSVPEPAAAKAPFVQPKAGDDYDRFDPHPIVGLWHLIYTADSVSGATGIFPPAPPTFTFLESYKTWHRDGTEFENAFLDPKGGNICFGVWKDLGERTVKLHHIGLMFDTEGNVKAVFTNDEINVVAANGQSYSGSFTFKLFPPTDVYGTGNAIVTVKGTTAGTRINVD